MLATNTADLAFIAGPPTTSDMALYPDMYAYPLLASGNGPIYNLPNMPVNFVLSLRMRTLALIFAANITWWNDPLIQADNPNFTMPNMPITVVWKSSAGGTNKIFTEAMSDVDPLFAASVNIGYSAVYPEANFSSYKTSTDFSGPSLEVALTPYSICFGTPEASKGLGATQGNMINSQDNVVSINKDSVGIAAISQGVTTTRGAYCDCSGSSAALAFPVCGYIYMLYNQNSVRTTCAAKLNAYTFLDWQVDANAQKVLLAAANNMYFCCAFI